VNIAKRRPTKQSSALFEPLLNKTLSASLAVDGNADNNIFDGSCMSTDSSDGNSWMAVDLGGPTRVTGIQLTNAQVTSDTCGG
jgi:hypothetical protein